MLRMACAVAFDVLVFKVLVFDLLNSYIPEFYCLLGIALANTVDYVK